eukprot:jgi/Botrbrau1/22274/Bobra.0138s0030.1
MLCSSGSPKPASLGCQQGGEISTADAGDAKTGTAEAGASTTGLAKMDGEEKIIHANVLQDMAQHGQVWGICPDWKLSQGGARWQMSCNASNAGNILSEGQFVIQDLNKFLASGVRNMKVLNDFGHPVGIAACQEPSNPTCTDVTWVFQVGGLYMDRLSYGTLPSTVEEFKAEGIPVIITPHTYRPNACNGGGPWVLTDVRQLDYPDRLVFGLNATKITAPGGRVGARVDVLVKLCSAEGATEIRQGYWLRFANNTQHSGAFSCISETFSGSKDTIKGQSMLLSQDVLIDSISGYTC